MATVTVYTADRMQQIEDDAVISGAVVGDTLVLTQHDGDQINAGNVRGPKGSPGNNGWQVCTSTTRPATPSVGQTIYETDTGNTLVYQSAATGWTPPWNTAWGQRLSAWSVSRTTDFLFNGTGIVDGPSITITVPANRRIRLESSLHGMNTQATQGDRAYMRISEGATLLQQMQLAMGSTVYQASGGSISIVVLPSVGSHTYKLGAAGGQAGFNYNFQCTPQTPWTLNAFDEGPNGKPV